MKKLITLVAILLAGITTHAQSVKFGIKGGANFANFTGDIDTDMITGVHVGAVLEYNVTPRFSVQAEGLYSTVGGDLNIEVPDGAVAADTKLELDYISVPVLAKVYIIPGRLSVTLGPQFSFIMKEYEDLYDYYFGEGDDKGANSFELAASGGVEVNIIGGLFAQARYNMGLTKVGDEAIYGNAKNGVFQLSIGYYF